MQGFAAGIYSVITPIYCIIYISIYIYIFIYIYNLVKEISPINIRGRIIAFFQIFVVIGMVLSCLIGFLCSYIHTTDNRNPIGWRLMFGFPIFIALFQLYMLLKYFDRETPTFYLAREQKDNVCNYYIYIYITIYHIVSLCA